ncbi:hypothetical protein AB2M62_19960 [Sphingomonas sp. MMS12-HWE2-04]|uniref:hypothetical protein n=1 Tax=Sphingomonas sp. MMS12-HWE2-04 TaxID=3234199 RepID=UPI003850C58E
MAVQTSQQDTLSNIAYENELLDAADASLLRNQVSSTDGQIVIVSAFGCSLVFNYSFGSDAIDISIVLQTPLGNETLASGTLNPNNPSITVGGSIGSFKAQATVSFDFGTMVFTASGEVCAPIVGCKKGSISVHV